MLAGQAKSQRTGNPTLWTVRVLRLTLIPLAEATEPEELESVQLPDRELALAVGHQLIDRHSHEVLGFIGLGLMLLPPDITLGKSRRGYRHCRVSAEALEQARMLGVTGDVEAMVRRMVKYSVGVAHPLVNRRQGGFAMRVENGVVTWFGLFDQAGSPRSTR